MQRASENEELQPSNATAESRAWKVLFFVTLINSAHASLSVVGIPIYATRSGLEQSQMGALLASLPICAGVSAFAVGIISDYCNRKHLLQFGLLALACALALHGFAQDFASLLTLRCLAGFASGTLIGLPATLLSDCFPQKRQQSLTGKTLCGYAIGQTIGIPVGIALLDWIDFLALSSGIGLIALLCFPFTWILPNLANPNRAIPKELIQDYLTRARQQLSRLSFILIALSSFLSFASLSLFYVVFALWLFDTEGLRPSEIAPMYLAGGLLQVIVFAFLVKQLAKLQARITVSASLLLNALVFGTAYFALQNLLSATLLFVVTLGVVSLRIPALQYLVHNLGSTSQKGLRMSLIQCCNQLGKASGATLASVLYSRIEAHQAILASSLLAFLCSAIIIATKGLNHPASNDSPRSSKSGEAKREEKGRLWHARCSLKMSSKQLASEYQSRNM